MKVFPHPLRRSPFTRPPLRSPGQSVQREMDRLLEDRILPIIMFTFMMGFMAVYDWTVVLLQYTPRPEVSTTLASWEPPTPPTSTLISSAPWNAYAWDGMASGSWANSWRTSGRTGRVSFTTWWARA